ncbi:dihydrolipoamide acetyltransferase family protein [Bacillus massiliigorillae]|uniref:dihydrolipoamide acetyltransferase family protein n=1 Tax=Bacillus massiliigorillae TaxID=1243664 RepID=UPI00039AFCC1|nr:dihydrolipoamide acetyltransferase family protein [Bacillus massiliigorillae]
MIEFKLPDIGEGMHEGEILQWFIQEGELVKQDQPILEIQTDKVNAELTAPATGKIIKLFFNEGEVVEVGNTLFQILEENETFIPAPPIVVEPPSNNEEKEMKPITNTQEVTINRPLATPYVRQLARELNIDLQLVNGTGPAGRITEHDLQNYQKPQPIQEVEPILSVQHPCHTQEERIPLKAIRKKIAEHMVKSSTIIPHVTHVDELEMDALKTMRDQFKTYAEQKNIKLTFLPFFIKAIVTALQEFKMLNASVDDHTNEIIVKNYYHIGIATDTPAGLIVPVIKNANQKSIFQLAEEIKQLAAQAREGTLTLEQITGSTFTISNVGAIGGLHATPIINHPEVAILALHKMEPRMVIRDWEGVIRYMMNMSLSFDHRVIDGVTAVRFTNRIKELLENPNLLFMEMN